MCHIQVIACHTKESMCEWVNESEGGKEVHEAVKLRRGERKSSERNLRNTFDISISITARWNIVFRLWGRSESTVLRFPILRREIKRYESDGRSKERSHKNNEVIFSIIVQFIK